MNIGVKVSKSPKGRRFAIGDIHGCYNTFESLVEDKIALRKEDQLFLLGDYIDRGIRNREVLDYIIELKEEGFQVFPLMGNHEYFVLRDLQFYELNKNKFRVKDLIKSEDLLNHEGQIDDRYLSFIRSLPYYYELDRFILVHAGFDFEEEDPLTDKMSMIYTRKFEVDKAKTGGKTVIHGHTPINFKEIEHQLSTHKSIGRINLDNGCVYKHYQLEKRYDLGRLCGLNLDSMELIFLDNID